MEESSSPYLDFSREIRIKENHLTLWDQQGKIQHAVFHLNDSIPKEERDFLVALKENFLKSYPLPWNLETQRKYYNLIGKRQDKLLDAGHGNCIFRNPDFRKILEDSIKFYNEKYYSLISFVIMPNHVHMLLVMNEEYKIEVILGRLKRYVATRVNRMLGREGEIWYKENYCRLMRNVEHFKFTRAYIKENPKYLKSEEFSYWEA